jgi:hypothetical protein
MGQLTTKRLMKNNMENTMKMPKLYGTGKIDAK